MNGIRIRNAVVLRGHVPAVNGVNADFTSGKWHGVIGANGSGKTTLLRAVAGRLPVASGECWIGGTDCAGDITARAREIGFAPSPEMLPPALRVKELLAIIAGSRGNYFATLSPLRKALGLENLLDRRVGTCSAGMRQRVAIACAFAAEQRIVILDEPFNWLDPVAAFELRAALRVMVSAGLTLITALHDLTTLVTSCDESTLLADGRVALALSQEEMRGAARDPVLFEQRTIGVLRSASQGQDGQTA